MQPLQFVELDESGRLVLADAEGTHFSLPVDDRVRAALRPRLRASSVDRDGNVTVSPRDVQAMIRAGQPAEDVAASTGWDLARVRRFEGPVLAEREHLVQLAKRAAVRASGRTDGSHTLERRVHERLQSRGVDLTAVFWDAARGEAHGPWTVIVAFAAGGKERRAAWQYDVASRALVALDDEARWLSEDEQALPGGLAGHPLLGTAHGEDEAAADLMATMRERRQRRGRRSQVGTKRTGDAHQESGQPTMRDEVLPLEDLAYDPETMGDPPAAHPRPAAWGSDETGGGAEPEGGAGPGSAAQPVSPEEAQRAVGKSPGRRRAKLRLPKVAASSQEDEEQEPETAEGVFAKVEQDPNEVTFEEFFGTDDEPDNDEPDDDELDEMAPTDVAPVDDSPVGDSPVDDAADDDGVGSDDAGDDAAVSTDDQSTDTEPAPEDPTHDASPDDSSPDDAAPGDADTATDAAPGRKGRTSVPSWDDIMFGSRDRR